eukprot:4927961-Amphidinium_carterae.1
MAEVPVGAIEVPHCEGLHLYCFGEESWLTHAISGERCRLDAGSWELVFHPESGFGALVKESDDGAMETRWAKDLLQHSVWRHKCGEGVRYYFVDSLGAVETECTRFVNGVVRILELPMLRGEHVVVRVYMHSQLTQGCKIMWTLKGLVQFMWGQPALARGWITKRVQGWSSRAKQCGLDEFTLRQSVEGTEKTLARSATQLWLPPLAEEDDWTMPTMTLVTWLLACTSSVKAVGIRAMHDTRNYAHTLFEALLNRVLAGVTLTLSALDFVFAMEIQDRMVDAAQWRDTLPADASALLVPVFAPHPPRLHVAELYFVLIHLLTHGKLRNNARAIICRLFAVMCRELAMYLDIHLHAVLGDHHADVPIARGHTMRRGRNVPRSIRLLRAAAAKGRGCKRSYAAGVKLHCER